MNTFEQFLADFRSLQEGLTRDYAKDDERVELCEVLHQELRLGQTPVHNAQERSALLKTEGVDVEPDSIKLTEEHVALHGMLGGARREAALMGFSNDEFVALMFAIGRRYGLKEAADLMDADDPFGELNA
jgi:hypothetical protein